jgi:hypothetical protein
LATCQEEKKKSIIIIIKEKKNLKNTWYQTLFYLLKFWPQFDRRICRICSSWISDDKAINYSVKIRLRKRQWVKRVSNTSPRSNDSDRKEKKATWTRSKSEEAFTGRNRDLGTFIPIAWSKNW